MREKTALKLLMERAKITLEARCFNWSRPESPYWVGKSLKRNTLIQYRRLQLVLTPRLQIELPNLLEDSDKEIKIFFSFLLYMS
jgi:hypothetical protein